MTIEEANIKFLNKNVLVSDAINGKSVGGKCTFVGINEFLGNRLQITVDRLPVKIKSLDQIKLHQNYREESR